MKVAQVSGPGAEFELVERDIPWKKMGGARVILATALSSISMAELVDGLGANGKMVVIGAAMEPIEASPMQLIQGRKSIQGGASGIPTDSEDTLRFAEISGVRPMIESTLWRKPPKLTPA
jgi:D-arabinose 1-dehydrogenase-like Zn-dependent alcohol dehydrogenase